MFEFLINYDYDTKDISLKFNIIFKFFHQLREIFNSNRCHRINHFLTKCYSARTKKVNAFIKFESLNNLRGVVVTNKKYFCYVYFPLELFDLGFSDLSMLDLFWSLILMVFASIYIHISHWYSNKKCFNSYLTSNLQKSLCSPYPHP